MIFEELLYAFRNDLEIEYLKRGIKDEVKIRFNDKQIKLLFSKVLSDLQKEFKIIESKAEITTIAGEAAYALTRDFMTLKDAYYNDRKLEYVSIGEIHDGITEASYPVRYGLRWENSYPYIVVNPAPSESGKTIIVKYYGDMKLYSINDGMDSKSNEVDDTKYLKIPTMFDAAILLGMISEIFDDRRERYEREKLRLKSMRANEFRLNDYNMTGVNDQFPKTTQRYNSSADNIPTVLPSDPV